MQLLNIKAHETQLTESDIHVIETSNFMLL